MNKSMAVFYFCGYALLLSADHTKMWATDLALSERSICSGVSAATIATCVTIQYALAFVRADHVQIWLSAGLYEEKN